LPSRWHHCALQCDHLAHGIKEQADVSGKVHIGFNHKGVAAPTQRLAGLFFYQYMATLNDALVDLV
jgi:hypothetical protein